MRIRKRFIAGLIAVTLSPVHGQETEAEKDRAAREKWAATKQKIEASGFVFDLAEHTPSAVPDATKNFAEHPLIAELFTPAAKQDPKSTRLGKIDLRDVPGFPKPPLGFKTSPHKRFDLPSRAGDASLDHDEAARRILKALGTWEGEFAGLAEAARRPDCSFPFTWERPMLEIGFLMPSSTASHLSWRALCHLQLGQIDLATRDTLTLLHLTRHNRNNPSGLGLLATIGLSQYALRPVRDGIELQRWDEAALARFEHELAKLDFSQQLDQAMRFELAFSERISMDWINRKLKAEDFAPLSPKGIDTPVPHAIYERLNTAAGTVFDIVFEEQPKKPIPLPGRLRKMQAFAGEPTDRDDARSAVATKYVFGLRSLQAQVRINSARVAIAIERFRLKHGKLPASLDELAPGFLDQLPLDPMTGKPLRFGVLPDSSIVIYSLGWDGDDDGGTPVAERGNRNGDGDWVWRTTTAAP